MNSIDELVRFLIFFGAIAGLIVIMSAIYFSVEDWLWRRKNA